MITRKKFLAALAAMVPVGAMAGFRGRVGEYDANDAIIESLVEEINLKCKLKNAGDPLDAKEIKQKKKKKVKDKEPKEPKEPKDKKPQEAEGQEKDKKPKDKKPKKP